MGLHLDGILNYVFLEQMAGPEPFCIMTLLPSKLPLYTAVLLYLNYRRPPSPLIFLHLGSSAPYDQDTPSSSPSSARPFAQPQPARAFLPSWPTH